jgi:hypothetical protein
MGKDIAGTIEEFISLNGRFLRDDLAGHERNRWDGLAWTLDATAVSVDAREHGGQTRRQHARAPVRCTVEFRRPPTTGTAETLDLSCGGCALESPCQLHQGDEVELDIGLPGRSEPLRTRGRVCWATPARGAGRWRAGICFLGLAPAERDLLAACVLARLAPHLSEAA